MGFFSKIFGPDDPSQEPSPDSEQGLPPGQGGAVVAAKGELRPAPQAQGPGGERAQRTTTPPLRGRSGRPVQMPLEPGEEALLRARVHSVARAGGQRPPMAQRPRAAAESSSDAPARSGRSAYLGSEAGRPPPSSSSAKVVLRPPSTEVARPMASTVPGVGEPPPRLSPEEQGALRRPRRHEARTSGPALNLPIASSAKLNVAPEMARVATPTVPEPAGIATLTAPPEPVLPAELPPVAVPDAPSVLPAVGASSVEPLGAGMPTARGMTGLAQAASGDAIAPTALAPLVTDQRPRRDEPVLAIATPATAPPLPVMRELPHAPVLWLRRFFLDLQLGPSVVHWLPPVKSAVAELVDTARQNPLGLMTERLVQLGDQLEAIDASHELLSEEPRFKLLKCYTQLARVRKSPFTLEPLIEERSRMLLGQLLIWIEESTPLSKKRLQEQGLDRLESFAAFNPASLAVYAFISLEQARAVLDGVERLLQTRSRKALAFARSPGQYLNERLESLQQIDDDYLAACAQEDRDPRRRARRERVHQVAEIQLILTLGGELDLVRELERMSVQAKLLRLRSFVAKSSPTGGEQDG